MAYLGFPDGLCGSPYLRSNLGYLYVYIYNYIYGCFYASFCLFLCYVVPILWLVWCLFDVL